MKVNSFFSELKEKPALILLVTPFLLTFYKYYGSMSFYEQNFARALQGSPIARIAPLLYDSLSALLLLGIVPILLVKFYFKERTNEYGLRQGSSRFGFLIVAISFPLIALTLLLPSARLEPFQREYPLYKPAAESIPSFLLYAAVLLIYYFAWEFFFRGFMLFGLRTRCGDTLSILLQTMASCLMHIGKPEGEIIMSIFAGWFFGWIALRTRSIWYTFLLHWLIGVSHHLLIILLR